MDGARQHSCRPSEPWGIPGLGDRIDQACDGLGQPGDRGDLLGREPQPGTPLEDRLKLGTGPKEAVGGLQSLGQIASPVFARQPGPFDVLVEVRVTRH